MSHPKNIPAPKPESPIPDLLNQLNSLSLSPSLLPQPPLSHSLSRATMDDDLPFHNISIPGPTLASLIQRISASPSDSDGLLFGHVSQTTPSTLSDDSPLTHPESQLVATITSFFCPSSPLSFYDSAGKISSSSLNHLLSTSARRNTFIGWFSARRKTPLRPSMREFAVTRGLSTKLDLHAPANIFFLFTTPIQEQVIHTHEYRAYQFRSSTTSFEPKSIDIINIGPAFRGHYGAFTPNAGFPMLACEVNGAMNEDKDEESLREMKRISKYQRDLDACAEGFAVENLGRLMGSEAARYTATLEELYEKMLVKIESLARQVEMSNEKVIELENFNRKLRYKVARTGLE